MKIRNNLLMVVLCIALCCVVGLMAGCSGGGGSGSDGGGDGETNTGHDAEKIIGSAGGAVQVTDFNNKIFGAKVEISPDALESDTAIFINSVDTTSTLTVGCPKRYETFPSFWL